MKKTLLSIIALTAFSVNAQNIFKEDFSTFTNGALHLQNGWSNQTPIGLGACFPAGTCASLVKTSTINYTGWGTSTKAVEIKNDSDSNGKVFTATSTDFYLGFVINVSNASGTPQDNFRIINSASTTAFRLYIKSAGGGTFNVGTLKGTAVTPTYASGAYNYNQNHLIVFKYSVFSGTNDDILNVYVDPVFASGEPAVPSISTTAGADAGESIGRFSFRQNAATGTLPTGEVGLISVSSTWAGLSFLPLANQQFTKSTFEINASQVNVGLLTVESSINLENANINIYDIQGRMIENKKVALTENNNEIAINPISNSGIYIVEIVSGDRKVSQKIAVK